MKKRKRSRKGFGTTLAYIRWFDSAIYKGEGCLIEDWDGVMENESCGILVREDKDEMIIALDRCLDTKYLRCLLCIPRVNIRLIRKFKVKP